MLYSPAAAYYSIRPNINDTPREVIRAVRNLPKFDRLDRRQRKTVYLGILREHNKCQMVFHAQKSR